MKLKDTFVLFPGLQTPRLALRMLQPEDAENLAQLYSASEVNRWLDWDGPETASEAKMVISFFLQQYKSGKNLRWAIAEKDTNALMGTVLLSGFQKNLIADIGYDFATQYWRKGYMYEALSEVLRFAFEIIGCLMTELIEFNMAHQMKCYHWIEMLSVIMRSQ